MTRRLLILGAALLYVAAVVPMAELVAPLLPHPWLELRGALGPRNFAERS